MENQVQNSMYLSTLPNQRKKYIHNNSSLNVADIEGARPKYQERKKYDRPVFYDHIEKSRPRQLIPAVVNRPNNPLELDDISGTRAKFNKFTTKRCVNPLNPQYEIYKDIQYLQFQEPKFVRDNMAIDDIDGVRTKETFASKIQREGKKIDTKQEIMQILKQKQPKYEKSSHHDILEVKDINQKGKSINHQSRVTNPLEPHYDLPANQNGEKQDYGFIKGSKFQANKYPKEVDYSLSTNDIMGARPKKNNFINEKKEAVIGSKPETLKRGISSNRKTDPLQPRYDYPGWSENKQSTVNSRPKTTHQKFDAFIK